MSKVVPEYAPVSKIKQNRKQPTKPHNPSPPNPPPPTTHSSKGVGTPVQKGKLRNGARGCGVHRGRKSNQASEPNTPAAGPRGSFVSVRSSRPGRQGWRRGFHHLFLEGKASQLFGASLLAFKAEPSRPAPWGGPTAGYPGNKTGSNCWLGGVRSIMQEQAGFLGCSFDPLPPGGARGPGEAEGSRLLWI